MTQEAFREIHTVTEALQQRIALSEGEVSRTPPLFRHHGGNFAAACCKIAVFRIYSPNLGGVSVSA